VMKNEPFDDWVLCRLYLRGENEGKWYMTLYEVCSI
jgi:hypothetical protein